MRTNLYCPSCRHNCPGSRRAHEIWAYKMSGKRLFEALDLYEIPHAEKMKYTRGKAVELPKCCILSCQGHFLLYKDGVYYDNISGVFAEFDFSRLTAYLEIPLG